MQCTAATKEDRIHSHVGRERLGIAGGERLGKGALGCENLPGQRLPVLRLGADDGRQEECEGRRVPEAHETVLKRR